MSARNGNPKMQRAHFQLIADVLKETAPLIPKSKRNYLIQRFAARLRSCNEHFDYFRFERAATYTPEKK